MDKRKGMGKDKEFAFTGILEKLFCKNKNLQMVLKNIYLMY